MLPINFFDRSSVLVAKDLLGKVLCRKVGKAQVKKFKIVETEAYEGLKDLASHASRGLTKRNAPMFEGPGTIYVYFTYGMHWMLNIVCGPAGHPSAVLIRGVEGITGPARLTKHLGIDKSLNNRKLGKAAGLWIESPPLKVSANQWKIIATPRIGVKYAGPIWSQKKWRFVLNPAKQND
jgi:DNA-3-methyladenine glycosylase